NLKDLAFRNALDLRHSTFKSDIERLVERLKASVWQLPDVISPKPNVQAQPSISIRLEVPQIVHNVALLHPAGMGIVPSMQMITQGSIVGATNKFLGLTALFYASNGAPLFANSSETQFRTQFGNVASFSGPIPIIASPGFVYYTLGIPY